MLGNRVKKLKYKKYKSELKDGTYRMKLLRVTWIPFLLWVYLRVCLRSSSRAPGSDRFSSAAGSSPPKWARSTAAQLGKDRKNRISGERDCRGWTSARSVWFRFRPWIRFPTDSCSRYGYNSNITIVDRSSGGRGGGHYRRRGWERMDAEGINRSATETLETSATSGDSSTSEILYFCFGLLAGYFMNITSASAVYRPGSEFGKYIYCRDRFPGYQTPSASSNCNIYIFVFETPRFAENV